MKRNLFLIIAVLAAALCSCSAGNDRVASLSTPAAAASPAQTKNVKQTIRRLDSERSQAIVQGDAATLERTYDDDYGAVRTSGVVRNKAQAIADNRSGALKIESQIINLSPDHMVDHPAGAHYVLWNG